MPHPVTGSEIVERALKGPSGPGLLRSAWGDGFEWRREFAETDTQFLERAAKAAAERGIREIEFTGRLTIRE